jgi:hypothetical protein
MKKPNEQDACDAFITILKSVTGVEYVESESPDEVNRSTPEIDFVLVSSRNENEKIAVEHTTVESFEWERRYVIRWRNIVNSVNDGCRGQIPPDRYYFLAAPPALADSLAGKRKERFVSDLSHWASVTASKLLMVDCDTQTEYEGHKITLMCRGDHVKLNGNVWSIPQEPEDQKALQVERLGRAVADKLPKLGKYKGNGFKTALLLEDVAGTLGASTLRAHEASLEGVDYLVVFVSNEDRMIVGNVWKEMSAWYWSVPGNRRFSFYKPARS